MECKGKGSHRLLQRSRRGTRSNKRSRNTSATNVRHGVVSLLHLRWTCGIGKRSLFAVDLPGHIPFYRCTNICFFLRPGISICQKRRAAIHSPFCNWLRPNVFVSANIGSLQKLSICLKSSRKFRSPHTRRHLENWKSTFDYRLEPNPEYWEGKRGACIGALYSVISERNAGIPPGGVIEICTLLRDSINPQAESIVRVIRRFAAEY